MNDHLGDRVLNIVIGIVYLGEDNIRRYRYATSTSIGEESLVHLTEDGIEYIPPETLVCNTAHDFGIFTILTEGGVENGLKKCFTWTWSPQGEQAHSYLAAITKETSGRIAYERERFLGLIRGRLLYELFFAS